MMPATAIRSVVVMLLVSVTVVAVDLVRYEYRNKLVEGLAKLKAVTSVAEAPAEALQASGGAQ